MKKLLSLITVVGAVFAPLSAQADPLTGKYKIAVVQDEVEYYYDSVSEKETEGESGRGTVYYNSKGKLRFKGWIEQWDYDDGRSRWIRERTSLLGVVNPDTGEIRLTKVGGVPVSDLAVTASFVLEIKIIKRNGVVVGLTGSGSATEYDYPFVDYETYDITGYKTRDLPE